MKIFICLISFIIMSGCAKDMVWSSSNGKSEQQFYADRASCSAMAGNGHQNQVYEPKQQADGFASGLENGLNLGNAIGTSNSRSQIFNDCMMGNGWNLIPAE